MLDARALNRALLHRQGLPERTPGDVEDTLERLVGLQAQEPANPYLALWSRLGFLASGVAERRTEFVPPP